jgi:transglutaminase-like putative cysteine protease
MNETNAEDSTENLACYYNPGEFIDSTHPEIRKFADSCMATAENERQAVINIYYAVRDGITYDPWYIGSAEHYYRASDCLQAGRGFCIPKAALMAACVRHAGIPARVGYADVRNHIRTPKLEALIDGDVYVWHSYAEVYLDRQWVKATPAFDLNLCRRFDVHPLEFDGYHDSLFQEFDRRGRRHMEYVKMRDNYQDVPYAQIVRDFRKYHPRWLDSNN